MTTAASSLNHEIFGAFTTRAIATPALIQAMIDSGDGISDLVLSPGRPPQVERHGDLEPVTIAEMPVLRPEDTAGVACDLINGNEHVLTTLKEQGACDLSFSLPDRCRFRVNIFRDKNGVGTVMRHIPSKILTAEQLGLPACDHFGQDRHVVRMVLDQVFEQPPAEVDCKAELRMSVHGTQERAVRSGVGIVHHFGEVAGGLMGVDAEQQGDGGHGCRGRVERCS